MDRRTFLATPLVFGLSDLFAQENKAPSWLAEALQRMKETGRCGIVLIVPDKKEEQRPLGEALAARIDGPDRATRALLCEAVFLCLPRRLAEGAVCAAGDRNTRYLLDPSGKAVDSDTLAPSALESPKAFASSFDLFLHGRDGNRLRERAEAIRKTLPAGVKEAIEQLDADEVDIREKASALLLRHADRILPLLADLSRNADPVERRGRAADVIEAYFLSIPAPKPGPQLPYGCRIPRLVSAGCGSRVELEEGEQEERIAVLCGRGSVSRPSARFLSFLLK